ncbi:hypothetical protein [Actinoallomurus sp. NPDC052274]|uniref:hypothetical protein n=1 Tax=Actinoallomurus sp. NPDC052274 TaxID=3155420 RepID=UPI0034412FA4
MRVAVEAATRIYQALADWAEWARTVPPAVPATDDDAAPAALDVQQSFEQLAALALPPDLSAEMIQAYVEEG